MQRTRGRQAMQNLFRNAIREVTGVRMGIEIQEWQDGDGIFDALNDRIQNEA
ncbi:MAG: hypothetical protein KC572_13845 [Gammaproteobacteria bacterium]|nr:hypothetical protein [Gammaproteobacteria bacterium]